MKIYTGDGGAARFFIPRGGGGGLVKLLCLLGGKGRRNIHNAARPWLASPFDVPPDLHYRYFSLIENSELTAFTDVPKRRRSNVFGQSQLCLRKYVGTCLLM
jgi:hypothetical protein